MNLFFVADDRVDYSGPEHMKLVYEAIIDAFRNPTKPRPAGELLVGEMTRQCVPEKANQHLNPPPCLNNLALIRDACASAGCG